MIHAVCETYMGLGNRLKCIAAACRFKREGEQLVIHWPLANIGCTFAELFSLEGIDYTEDADECDYRAAGCRAWHVPFLPGDCDSQDPLGHERSGRIDWAYNNTPQAMIDAYKPIFARIKPNPYSIRLALAAGTPAYAMHVRNNPEDWPADRDRPISQFVAQLKSIPDRVYLCCHRPEVQQQIMEALPPDKVYTLPCKDFSNILHAVADMLVLGKARHLYASYVSTFPECGWWIGGCNGVVTVI